MLSPWDRHEGVYNGMIGAWPSDEELCADAELIADSFSPAEVDFPIYRDMVQAKLDALRFDEDGYRWVGDHLKLCEPREKT